MTKENVMDGVNGVVAAVASHEDEVTDRVVALEAAIEEMRSMLASMKESVEASIAVSAAKVERKTVSGGVASLLTKTGVGVEGGISAGALDAAMESLSVEQRIAVKSQLMRAGVL